MKKVKVYTTKACFFCLAVKEFLDKNKIKFTEIDISKDEKALKYLTKKIKIISVPVVEINKEIIIGFDKEKIEKALKCA